MTISIAIRPRNTIGTTFAQTGVETADLDADGDQEIIVAHTESEVAVYSLDSSGSFSAPAIVATMD